MRRRWLAVVIVATIGGLFPFDALAQSGAPPNDRTCISPAAASEATACPHDAIRMRTSVEPTRAPVRTTPASPPPAANTPRQAPSLHIDPVDPHHDATRSQIRRIQAREEELLASLLRSMRRNDPARPNAILRLAETESDLASSANSEARALDEAIFRARRANQSPNATQLERQQQQLLTRAAEYRRRMIVAYETFIADHGDDARTDSVLYSLAFAYQQAHDMDRARATYRALIQRFPTSHYLPDAFLAFGDYYFDRGELPEARQFYEHVIAIRTPENTVYGYALYKLAWVLFNQQEYAGALQRFYDVIDYGRQNPESPSAGPLMRTARAELVTAYGALYGASRPLRVDDALSTFRRYAENEQGAFDMLNRLAELYHDGGQWPNAIAVYHQLMAQRPQDDRVCTWQAQIARAVVASRPRPEQMTELTRLVDLYSSYRASSGTRPTEAMHACRDAAARVIFDVASHWHLEAIGLATTGERQTTGTRNATTMRQAAQLYAILADRFPDLDDVTFPDFDRRDWPTRYRIAFYRAELLRDQGDHCACGPAYDSVIDMQPSGEYTEDAGYKAVLCYNSCASQTPPVRAAVAPTTPLEPRAFNTQEQAMLRAFTRYVCFAGGTVNPATQPDAAADLLTIRYRRAYLYYTSNHFEQAATLFREVAFSDPSVRDPEGLREFSANLYLDSLNVMASRWNPPRTACYATMQTELAAIHTRRCAGAAAEGEFCAGIEHQTCDIMRRNAAALHNAHRYLEAAEAWLLIAREHQTCPGRDEILAFAAEDLQSGSRLGRAIRVREYLVDHYLADGSQHAVRALYRLAGNYHAIQVYSRAADLYEQYAAYVTSHRADCSRADPEAVDHAADSLRQATIFRIALGEDARALANAASFDRSFGDDPHRRAVAAAVTFSIGQIYQDRAARAARDEPTNPADRARRDAAVRTAWQDVVRHYTGYVRRYASNGTLDEQIQGEVALGRGYWNLDEQDRAEQHFRAATEMWGARGEGETQIRAQVGEENANAAVERSKDSVAEARFYLAEADYRRFTRRHLPEYHGPASVAAFRAWESSTLRTYIERQQGLLAELTGERYRPLIEMRVPNWEIAATSRAADMFYQFALAIREAPIPPDVQHNEDLLAAYLELREQYVQQFMGTATHGFEVCIQRATTLHWYNEWSQRCERSLNAIDVRRYPLADEVRVEPSLIFSRPANAQPVYEVGAAEDL